MPEVIETGDRFVYWVRSERNPRIKYRVDLTANDGAGFCQCADFGCRKQEAIDAGTQILTTATTCKHLRSALWHFLRTLMPALAQQEGKPPRIRKATGSANAAPSTTKPSASAAPSSKRSTSAEHSGGNSPTTRSKLPERRAKH